ncbi:MAG: hypothetical protein H0W22_00080, partial [Chloroflexi bacterium]|nr:hypothetical protein [Chloroflexota bacterium]
MPPINRLTHPVAVLIIAITAAGCASGGPVRMSTSGPVASAPVVVPTAATAPAGAGDAWLVVGRPGEDALQVMLASSGEEDLELPIGVPNATWGRLLTVTPGRPNSLIQDLVVQPGFGGPVRSIDGAWRLPTVGLDPMPVGVSADGSTIVLVEDRAESAAAPTLSRFAIVERSLRSEPRIVELPGIFDFDTLSPDGS